MGVSMISAFIVAWLLCALPGVLVIWWDGFDVSVGEAVKIGLLGPIGLTLMLAIKFLDLFMTLEHKTLIKGRRKKDV
jgi:hypothetical protein